MEFQLVNPPKDGISQIGFSPTSDHHLAMSSWDKVGGTGGGGGGGGESCLSIVGIISIACVALLTLSLIIECSSL